MVQGKWVVKDQEVLEIDLEKLLADHAQAAKALLTA